ncbi:MAG: CPBP family intramembrane glutamic endopeptidase [Pseudolysinimonas sp.]|uniref:CPBP family intramembrane glutamic endopeptidase n=1 Tax=Pseudolysinimonas sp. TaxID=2680009 RepID=UPI003263A4EF
MDFTALALLGVVVGILVWRAANRERGEYARFKLLRATEARQKVYRRWVIEAAITLGGLSIAVIVATWVDIPALLADAQTWPPVAAVHALLSTPVGLTVAIGVAVLVLAALVVPVLLIRNSGEEPPALGDIRALLPRARAELPYGAALSLGAGVYEELLFRLGMPALIFAVTGNAIVAFVGATVLFGLLHVYQGPVGVLFATLLGVIFAFLYLVTGSILVAIVFHALIDLRSMVLIPVALGWVRPTGVTPEPPKPPEL